MQKSTTLPKTNLQTLPEDLKTLIFEYLSLPDFSSLQLVSHTFYKNLQNNSKLWAKHIFLKFLHITEEDDIFKKDYSHGTISINETNIDFQGMQDSKHILEAHFSLKHESLSFFAHFLDSSPSKKLVKYLFNSFKSPDYPVPILKKDIHFFPTNTSFQNFLTEVHFGLQSKPFTTDRRTVMVQTIMEKIKESFIATVDETTDIGQLMAIKWYGSMGTIQEERNPFMPQKTIGKCQSLTEKERVEDLKKIKPKRSNSDEIVSGSNVQSRNECFQLIEEFYDLIYRLVKNRCDMVLAYLKALKKSQDLLSEYNRLWSSFSLTIIEVNRILSPFARFFNQIYNCQDCQYLPEFSIWRVLEKVWLQEVFQPLSSRLYQAFRSTLMSMRSRDTSFEVLKQIYSKETILNSQEEILSQIYKSIFEPEIITKEEDLALLKGFYNAMSDLSYDEFTIFYWSCSPIGRETPKGVLDEIILEDTLHLCECCNNVLFIQPNQISAFMKADVKLVESIFDIHLACKIRECQASVIQDSLKGKLNAFVVNLQGDDVFGKSLNDEESFSSSYHLNFSGLKAFLNLEEGLKERLSVDKDYRESLCKIMKNDVEKFNFFLQFLMEIKENLRKYYQECQEISEEMKFRGFVKIEKKQEDPFGLNSSFSGSGLRSLKMTEKGSRNMRVFV